MPFDPSVVPAELIAALKRHEVVPLIGAGLSKQASVDIPNWTELLLGMSQRASEEGWLEPEERLEVESLISSNRYLMAAEHLATRFPGDAWLSFLEDRFRTAGITPSSAHMGLWKLEPHLLITTNYDQLIENAYAKQFGEVPTVMTYRQADVMQRAIQAGRLSQSPPMIFKIHGSIDVPSDLVLTERQYRDLIYKQPGYRLVLSTLFMARVVLMVGFSVDDPELLLLLENHRDALKYQSSPDYAFIDLPATSVKAKRLREDFGVQVIPFEATDGYPEVGEFIEFLSSQLP